VRPGGPARVDWGLSMACRFSFRSFRHALCLGAYDGLFFRLWGRGLSVFSVCVLGLFLPFPWCLWVDVDCFVGVLIRCVAGGVGNAMQCGWS